MKKVCLIIVAIVMCLTLAVGLCACGFLGGSSSAFSKDEWHVGTTSEWSVYQIDGYKNQMSECNSAYTYATWVISSADGFSPVAVAEAEKRGVRLIDGKEFAQMLLNIGLLDLNDAFN